MLATCIDQTHVHFFDNHDNSTPFVIGGICLSLLGLLGLVLNRVRHTLKGRKDATVPRNHSQVLVYAQAGGMALAAAGEAVQMTGEAVQTKRQDLKRKTSSDPEEENDIPIHTPKRRITVTGVFKVRGRIQRPAPDDQLVYLDE